MVKRLSLLLISILVACTSYAQLQPPRYVKYDADNGLAQNSVWDVIQDYRGFLWLATSDGLNRFDGYTMKHYKYIESDLHSIAGVEYFSFIEDSLNQLWIAHSRGVSIYDRDHDRFDNLLISNNGFNRIACTPNGRIWFVEEQKYLYEFDIKSKKIIKKILINSIEKDLNVNSTRSGLIIGHNIIYSLNPNFLLKINYKTSKAELVNMVKYHKYGASMGRVNKDTLFTVNDKSELIKYWLENERIKLKVTKLLGLKNNLPITRYTQYNNEHYLSCRDGIYKLDIKNFKIIELIDNFNNKNTSFNYIQTLYIDKSNNLYICTNGKGVYIYSPYKNKFPHIKTTNDNYNMIKSIVKTDDGKIITGLYNRGIIIFDSKNNYQYKHFINFIENETKIPDSSVLGIFNYSKNEIIFPYTDKLILFNHQNNSWKVYSNHSLITPQTYPHFVRYNNSLYLNAHEGDKNYIYDISNPSHFNVIYEHENKLITTFSFYNEMLIVIGKTSGASIYNLKSKKEIKLPINAFVKCILIDIDKKIYITTVDGLYVCTIDGKILNKYDVNSGLSADFIYAIVKEKNGKFWLSHNKGLSVLENNKFKNYDVSSGLQSNEFNTGAYFKDDNGIIYFGGVEGINIINPNFNYTNKRAPQIAINQISLDDEPYKSDTSYNELQSINLPYDKNTLSFDFSALDFSNPAENKYKYILEGYDDKWIESKERHFVRYSNLPHGNYRLKIMASNNDGIWSIQPRVININILPPFWLQTWFTILAIFIGIIGISAIVYIILYRQRLKTNRQLKLQFELEQERLRIARDLHDNVGAHLSYLISNLDWMISHPEKLSAEEEKLRLENLTETGRQAILTLRQTIWAINNQALYIEDFADKYKTFARKMLEFNTNINIHFEEEITGNAKLNPGITLHLFRICQEALGNVLKHAKASNITFNFRSNTDYLFYFTIKDDGIGFDTSIDYSNEHYGLINMQERAKECGATLEMRSEIGKGTSIELKIEN